MSHTLSDQASAPHTPPASRPYIRLLVADDHAVVRRGLRQIADESPDIRVVAEAVTGDETVARVREGGCDVLILDLNMPGPGGLSVLRTVRALAPDLPVLVLSIHGEAQYAARLLRAGASAYLQKETAPEELLKVIRHLKSGQRYLKPGQAEELVRVHKQPADQPAHAALSHREFEVLRGIASGQTVSQVATGLGLSVKTVSTYRTRLLDKMQMKTNSQLTHYGVKNGLVE